MSRSWSLSSMQQYSIESKSNNSQFYWTISETLFQTIHIYTEGELTFCSMNYLKWKVFLEISHWTKRQLPHNVWLSWEYPSTSRKEISSFTDGNSRSWDLHAPEVGLTWCHLWSLIREAIIFVITYHSNQKLLVIILLKTLFIRSISSFYCIYTGKI